MTAASMKRNSEDESMNIVEEVIEEVQGSPDAIDLHIKNIERVIGGGIPKTGIYFIVGSSGTYKSSLAYHICSMNSLDNRGNCLYLTFDQSRNSLLEHFRSVGLKIVKENKLSIIDISKLRKLVCEESARQRTMNWFKAIITLIAGYMKDFPCSFLVIDSMSTLLNLSPMVFPQRNMFYFFEEIKALGLTTFMIFDTKAASQPLNSAHEYEYLADGVIVLKMVTAGDKVDIKMQIKKMRRVRHDRHFFPLRIENGEFIIELNS
ncbi:MAG: ATPase domain-containing protein [Thermoplasmata archaeon]